MVAEQTIRFDRDAVYSKAALCKLLGVSGRCVERRVKKRQLPPPVAMGKSRYWTGEALVRFFDVRQAKAKAG